MRRSVFHSEDPDIPDFSVEFNFGLVSVHPGGSESHGVFRRLRRAADPASSGAFFRPLQLQTSNNNQLLTLGPRNSAETLI